MHDALILGSGRSGTSMVTGALARAGYFMGERLYPARDSNPLGFFEDPEINGINEELLAPHVPASQGLASPQRWLARLDHGVEPPLPEPLRRRIRALVARRPFCFKDPRFCYTLSAWRAELHDARFVCVFRDPAVTAASIVRECATTDYLRGVAMDAPRALAIWCAMYRQVLQQLRVDGERGEPGRWLFLHYDQVVGGEGVARLGAFLGANVDAAFPRAELNRSRAAADAGREANELYAELCEQARWRAPAPKTVAVPAPIPAAHAPELSVLICTYNRRQTLLECLQSFNRQTLSPQRYELVVVVDGSKDGSAQAVREFPSRAPLKLIERTENAGLASARSAAVAAARGEFILLVNDDTIAFPDLLERHLAVHRRRAPQPVSVLGTFEQPKEQLASALMRALERCDLVFAYQGMTAAAEYDWHKFWGCNVSSPRREVLAAGAFDACFHHYGCEDTDLGIRLDRRGLPVVFEPAARAWHRHVLAFDDVVKRQRMLARAYVRLFAKHPDALRKSPWGRLEKTTLAELDESNQRNEGALSRIVPAARQLAGLDCNTLERVGGAAAASVEPALAALLQLLKQVNPCWWSAGYVDALRELGAASFPELLSWRRDVPAWPLATDAAFRVLAWPNWLDEAELQSLLAIASDPALPVTPCLCLRHEAALDGDIAAAKDRLARVAERALPPTRDLNVLIVDDPVPPEDSIRLGRAVTCALLLRSSLAGERGLFFARAGAPGVRGVEDLLAFVPAAASAPLRATAPALAPVSG